MKNLEHNKSNYAGFLIFMVGVIYTFSPIFFPEAQYEPKITMEIAFLITSIGLIFAYPEPFKSWLDKIVSKFFGD